MKQPVRVTISGAAGNIGYALAFRVASGDMLGKDQPVILHLLEIPQAIGALKGVVMELNDCAFPLLHGIVATDDVNQAFKDCDYALLVGSKPRGPGMERKDLLGANGAIFAPIGKAINDHASRDIKVLVVGNPANTNALITQTYAPDIPHTQFSALMRLDHNRSLSVLAEKTNTHSTQVKQAIVWGNHSATQFPDITHTLIDGKKALDCIDANWYKDEFIPKIQQRGAAIIQARGASSAASAASATIDQMRDWVLGTPNDDWVSMAVLSDGSYGIEEGIFYSFPVRCKNGQYEIVQGLEINDFERERMILTQDELKEEREAVRHLLK